MVWNKYKTRKVGKIILNLSSAKKKKKKNFFLAASFCFLWYKNPQKGMAKVQSSEIESWS